jgi:C-terminal processing protease CtpA/Prc
MKGEIMNLFAGAKRARSVASKGAGALVAVLCGAWASTALAEDLSRFEVQRAHMMLNIIKKDVDKYYYDEGFHGIQLDQAFQRASDRVDQAKSISQMFAAISRPLLELNDSHTFFIPPGRSAVLHFGWQMKMIGDNCYVTAVEPKSDAEQKGLKGGDLILEVDGHRPTRDNLWGMYYVHRLLAPRTSLPILVQGPGDKPRRIEVSARVEQKKRLLNPGSSADVGDYMREIKDQAFLSRHRTQEVGEQLLVWKMPQFDLSIDEIRTEMNRVSKRGALVLDLRGNPGGSVETLEGMVGAFVGDKTKIGDLKGRDKQPPMLAKKPGDVYQGTLVVLVDSDSASAAELFARMMQIAGRAKVVGDRTSGSVMESRGYDHTVGESVVFATSITVADIIMPDGKSLEHAGVVPDDLLLPTAEDLVAGRDPVLAHAASLCGVEITPETAGGYFPFEWKR